MSLFRQLEQKVLSGELSWQQILMEIHFVKKQNHAPQIPMYAKSDEYLLGSIVSHYANPMALLMRKKSYEELPYTSKKLAQIIFNLQNGGKSCSRVNVQKAARRHGLKGKVLRAAEQALERYTKDISYYD